jgi:hypothetical protein
MDEQAAQEQHPQRDGLDLARDTIRQMSERINRQPTLDPLTLTIPCKPWSLNEERRLHWRDHGDRTRALRFATACLVPRDAGRYAKRVEIEATPVGVRMDAGNAYPTVKCAIDGLVDAGVITDDDCRFVERLILNASVPKGEPSLVLTVRPVR